MAHSKLAVAALLATGAIVLAQFPGSAQVVNGRPATQRPTVNPLLMPKVDKPDESLAEQAATAAIPRGNAKPLRVVKLLPTPISLAPGVIAAVQEEAMKAMKGWQPITNGAPKGGPVVVRVSATEARLFVRGADDVLYLTSFNPSAPGGPIDTAAWLSLGITATSEPNCIIDGREKDGSIVCAALNDSGKPFFGRLIADDFHVTGSLDGPKGSARPALMSAGEVLLLSGKTMFLRSLKTSNPYKKDTGDTGWTNMSGDFTGSAQCDSGKCAFVRAGNNLVLGDPFEEKAGAGAPLLPGGYSSVAPAPVMLPSTNYAVVVRSANGRAYRTVNRFGEWSAWVDEGGALMPNASISCIANGEQPLCFVQGLDGRIYWKKLGAASGL